MGIRLTQFSTELKVESLVNLCVYLSIIAISGYLGEIYCCLKFIREEFKNKMNYFCRIFREWGGGYPPSVKIINFFAPKKSVQNALKHKIK